jgi:hypothetical protein
MINPDPDNIWQKNRIEKEWVGGVVYMACDASKTVGLYWSSSSIFIGFDIYQ